MMKIWSIVTPDREVYLYTNQRKPNVSPGDIRQEHEIPDVLTYGQRESLEQMLSYCVFHYRKLERYARETSDGQKNLQHRVIAIQLDHYANVASILGCDKVDKELRELAQKFRKLFDGSKKHEEQNPNR